ncbi:CinA family protein [Mesomycoplasma lagogenitalium]|uniref:CinA family protein n=1 Tax=Mesomycoplasma lagogenitalium TaxID=171286 RepID=A0ABY8LTM6_9BACT|nr:CinA family protein [Mesomycoplasma lagogenitalium]WGI36591.1 CinA family protein [Mesomycoplasma lagogenitalium]
MNNNTKKITIASVESFTGGAFSAKIVSTPGASAYFKGSLVTYWNEIKEKLNVDTSLGVVNEKVALSMALNGKKFFNVDYCFAFTGNAGPDVLDQKPVGEVYIAINDKVIKLLLKGNRKEIINQAVEYAYNEFLRLKI